MIEHFLSDFWSLFYSVLQNSLSLVLYPIVTAWNGFISALDLIYVPFAGIYNVFIEFISLNFDFIVSLWGWCPNPAYLYVFVLYIGIFILYILLWLVRNFKDLVFRWV